MKNLSLLLLVVLGLGLAGCATRASRIQQNQAVFDGWPAEVQAAVRAGKIDIGYTTEQVKVALGQPSRVFTRTTDKGEEEVWAYYDAGPKFSFGVGVGTGGYRGAVGAGGAVGGRSDDSLDDATRITFKEGKVISIEQRTD